MTTHKKKWILYLAMGVYVVIMGVTFGNFFNSFKSHDSDLEDSFVSLANDSKSSNQSLIYDLIGEKKEKEPVVEETLSEGTNHQDVIVSSQEKEIQLSTQPVTNMQNTQSDTSRYYAAPTGGGRITTEQTVSLIIPQNTKVKAMLTENLSNLQTHVVHAIIQEDITVDGKRYPLKGATLIGAVTADYYLDRFNINFVQLFLNDNQSKQGISINGFAIDSDGKRGLLADHINKKRAEKIVNGITNTVKGIVAGATVGQFQELASAGSSTVESQNVSKELFLNKKRIGVIFDFPIEIIGGL
tara:strand:- start:1347 stop:2243 length:897 start_codon:yes stop_codon:yes gene_type:complete